jgi:hypothetical protein
MDKILRAKPLSSRAARERPSWTDPDDPVLALRPRHAPTALNPPST